MSVASTKWNAVRAPLPWGLLAALLLSIAAGMLGGCAGGSTPSASAPQENYTDSDEPENRKRATNRLRLAVLYFQDAKYNIALDEVKQAILADPGWFEGYNMRGLIYMRTNDFAGAEASFQKALSINPGSPDIRHNYGVLQCKLGRHADGMRLFSQALGTPGYTRRANTLVEQGMCQLAAGQGKEADQSFARAYEIEPANVAAGYHLALSAFQRGDLVRAQFLTRRMNNSEAANAETLWLGVKVERRLQNREAMGQLGTQLTKRFPQSREASALERGAFDE